MKRIIMASITAVVVIVVLAGTLIPILDDATATHKTFTNEGPWRMSLNENGNIYSFDNSTKEWSLNGDVIIDGTTSVANVASSVVLLDDLTVRANGLVRGATTTGNSTTTVVTNANDQIVITGNGLTSSVAATYAMQGYGADPDGDYLMTSYNTTVYMNGDSEIYATGLTEVTGAGQCIIHITGTIDDGVTLTISPVYKQNFTISDAVFSDVVINATPVEGYDDLYELSGITGNVSFTSTSTIDATETPISDFAISYSSYVVPYEVTAEKSVHFTDGENAIFNAIPVMIIIALLLGVVALVLRSRMD